jgi:shikimate dehydrogenase
MGLIGEHLSHSFSAPIHGELADYSYELFELAPHEVGNFVKNSPLDGFNVTIPYKQTVLPYLDTISHEANRIGSVNTVVRHKDGSVHGYNTDYFGFRSMLLSSKIPYKEKKALILGTGGASLTVKTVLEDLGVREIITVGRRAENNYDNLFLHYDAELIVNTTPVGMYPQNGVSPIDLTHFTKCGGVLDLIYNPSRTALLMQAERLGLPTANGLSMLVAQAVAAFELFTGDSAEEGIIEAVTNTMKTRSLNLILIGMPGCGKTTVGKQLSERMNRPFLDADEEFSRIHGLSPAEAIQALGEPTFREMEHAVLLEISKQSGTVIACGGGAVTRKENYEPLHQNGTIVYLKRALSSLSTEGRPLSQRTSPEALYRERAPFYEAFCDFCADNSEDPSKTAKQIQTLWEQYHKEIQS